MSFIEIEEDENLLEIQMLLSKSEVDVPRSKLSSHLHEEIKEINSNSFKFTTELHPIFSHIGLCNNEAKNPKHLYQQRMPRSNSLSKLSFIPNSPLICFKKSAHINSIKSVNRLTNISPLISGNCKPRLSTRVNILKLNACPNKRKLTSNQITDVLKPKLLGDTVRQCKNNFATQIIKQTIREVDEENNFNDLSSNIGNDKGNDHDHDDTSENQYVINIIQPQKSSTIEFENIKKQIKQTAKCAYTKTFSAFCGFVAFTFKTNDETFLDKMDIVLNKELHHNSAPHDLCHCFGVFPCYDNESVSSLYKERFHKHLLHRKDIAFNPVNAFFDTFIHFNKKIANDNKNNLTTIPTLLSLLIMNNHIYIANNSSSKCLCFNIDNMNISSLTKTHLHSTVNVIKDDFTEKKQQFQYSANTNKSLSQTITLKSMSFHSPHNLFEPVVTELSLNNLQQQDTIDFIVVVNENIASVLTNKEIILAILTSLLSNTLSYERTLETAIDSICIEAARKNAKHPLSVVFLPMKGYYSLMSGNQKEKYINNILQKLKSQTVNEDTLHSQCVVYKDNRNGKKTAITVHNHIQCKLSTHDVGEFKDNDVSSSFNSSYSKSRSCASSAYKEGVNCKKGKRFFCGCFA